jgi:hypothetical protein
MILILLVAQLDSNWAQLDSNWEQLDSNLRKMNILTVLFSAPNCTSLALLGTKGLKWYFQLFCSKKKDTKKLQL